MPPPLANGSKEGFSYVRPHLRPYWPLGAGERRDDCDLSLVSTVETLFAGPWS
jgi:hypothetical protein